MRTLATKQTIINQYNGFGNQLWDLAGARPSLDLQFANRKDLVDATTGSNLVDFTRASSGTYVGSDGLIKRATTNLLLQSEDFSTTWATTNASVNVNAFQSPNGQSTADKLIENSATSTHRVVQAVGGVSKGIVTFSIYLKAAERTSAAVSLFTSADGERGININLATGQIISSFSSPTSFTVSPAGNGWHRVSVSLTLSVNATVTAIVYLNAYASYAGDGTSGIYLWGAQLEQSTTVGEYVKTTSTINSAPRFNHDPTTGESLGLLVEESRTNLLLRSEEFDTINWTKTNVTVTGNAIAAPNGTTAADFQVENTATGIHRVNHDAVSVTAGATYTLSVFVKSSNRNLYANGNALIGARASFNLSTGAINVVGAGSAAITAFGNGWYRCTITGTAPTTQSGSTFFQVNTNALAADESYTGDGTSGIYLWGAQLEAGSFPTSYIPTTTAAVTRAADVAGIYDDNFGVFRKNLLKYSEEFDQTWIAQNGYSVRANQAIAPDGTLTADAVSRTNASTQYLFQNYTGTGTFTFSCWVRAVSGTATFRISSYNATDGTKDSGDLTATETWQRFSLTVTQTGATTSWYPCNGAINTTFYIWGAQLEQGSTATDYIKSGVNFVSRASSATYYDANGVIQTAAVGEARTAAYLPDGNGNFVSAGPLLLEPAGTNLLRQSADLSTTWVNVATSESTNVAMSPAGSQTADKLVDDTSDWLHYIEQNITVAANTAHSYTVFVKKDNYSTVRIRYGKAGSPFTRIGIVYNFDTGVITNSDVGTITSVAIRSATPFPNGWVRLCVAGVFDTTSTDGRIEVALTDNTGSALFTGTGSSGTLVWGAQLEAGSYPTSYIPTTTSTATRAADVSTSAATTVFESDWYRQEEGTVFDEFGVIGSTGSTQPALQFNDGTDTTRIMLSRRGDAKTGLNIAVSGVTSCDLDSGAIFAVGSTGRAAFAYKIDDFALAADGSNAVVDTGGSVPTNDRVNIGSRIAGTYLNGHIRRLTYWPQRLANNVLQTITQ